MNKIAPVFVLSGLFTLAARADMDFDTYTNGHWLSDAEVAAIVAGERPPPAPGSAEDKADLQASIAAQHARTERQANQIEENTEGKLEPWQDEDGMIGGVEKPRREIFYDALTRQIKTVIDQSAKRWRRPRPYQEHDAIHPLFRADGSSYPSGVAIHVFAFALVAGQVFPAQAADMIKTARRIAQGRVMAGVEYPSDVAEGERVGRELAKAILANKDIQEKMQAVRHEPPPRRHGLFPF